MDAKIAGDFVPKSNGTIFLQLLPIFLGSEFFDYSASFHFAWKKMAGKRIQFYSSGALQGGEYAAVCCQPILRLRLSFSQATCESPFRELSAKQKGPLLGVRALSGMITKGGSFGAVGILLPAHISMLFVACADFRLALQILNSDRFKARCLYG